MQKETIQRWEWIALVIIMLVAAGLRFGWLGTNSFSFDEARVSSLALLMARGGDFAELGMQSSTGIPNFPAAVWIFAIPYFLTPNPLVATAWAGFLSWLAVAGLWWLGRSGWGPWSGLSAAVLAAAAPFIVFYSRSIWSQNLLAPIAVLWAMAAVIGMRDGEKRWRGDLFLGLHAFLAGFAVQVHIAGIALTLASIWLGFRYRLWQRWLPIVVGGALALLAAAPYFYTIGRFGSGARAEIESMLDTPSLIDPVGFIQVVELAIGRNWEGFWLNNHWNWPEPLGSLLSLSQFVLLAGVIGGLAFLTWRLVRGIWVDLRCWRGRERLPTVDAAHVLSSLIPIWAIAAPLFFLRSKTPVYHQYMLTSLPALILAVSACAILWRRRYWGPTILIVTCTIGLIQSAAVVQTLNTISGELVEGGMGTPLSYPLTAAQTIRSAGAPVVIHTSGDQIAYDGDAAVFDVLFWDYPHQIVDGRSALLIPDEPSTLLATFATLPAWEMIAQLGLEGSTAEFPRRDGEPPYMAWRKGEDVMPSLTNLAPPIQLSNGAELRGWAATEMDDGRWRLVTHWYLSQPAESQQFQQFNHLYLINGNEPSQVRDVSASSQAWAADHHLFTWVYFDSPADAIAHFDVGMYTWPDLQRSPIVGQEDPNAPIRLVP